MEVTIEPGPGRLPQAFTLGSQRRGVVEILDRWPGFGYLYLKVRADDGGTYILRREDASGRWDLWLFRAPREAAGPPLAGE